MPITLDGTNGITTPTYGGADTSEYLVPVTQFKNRIINGAMVIDQRNAGASVSVNNGSSNFFITDRWFANGQNSDGVYTGQQVTTAPAGFNNSLQFTVTTADASIGSGQGYEFRQRVEGYNISDFGWGTADAKTVTLSFWVRSSLTGTFGGSVFNNSANRAYVFSYAISAANTWEYKTITIAGDTSGTWLTTNGTGLNLLFSLGAGSSLKGSAGSWGSTLYTSVTGSVDLISSNGATLFLTGVQLEVGSTATSFDYRPYGTELALCQRYYYLAASVPSYFATGGYFTASFVIGILGFPTTMRATPTLSATSGTNYYTIYRNGAGDSFDSLTINGPAVNYSGVENTTNVSGTAGDVGFIETTNASARVAFQAEL